MSSRESVLWLKAIRLGCPRRKKCLGKTNAMWRNPVTVLEITNYCKRLLLYFRQIYPVATWARNAGMVYSCIIQGQLNAELTENSLNISKLASFQPPIAQGTNQFWRSLIQATHSTPRLCLPVLAQRVHFNAIICLETATFITRVGNEFKAFIY